MTGSFTGRLKAALTGTSDARLVFLGNFEVEDQWARGEVGLPRLSFGPGNVIVNRMDEFALLLAGKGDHVVLKGEPDAGHLSHLEELGFDLPGMLVVERQDPGRTVTQDALEDPAVLRELGRLGARGAVLAAHGVGELEERLAERAGIALAAPPAAVCKAVNSKIYSRRLADELGIRQTRGWTCGSLAELDAAVEAARPLLADGRRVVLKDAFGVSGKGIEVVADERRLDRLHRMIRGRARKAGDDRVGLVLEEWVAKRADLNYQFTLARDGRVHVDFVKEALTEGGVHLGHRMPARLTGRQTAELAEVARRLGGRLAGDGYFGVVGVDAMIDPDGGLYPVVEINARHNMSTYQAAVQEAFIGSGRSALVRRYPVRLGAPLPFGALRRALADLLFDPARGTGLLINNYATVNAAAPPGERAPGTEFDGRLHGIVVADSADRTAALDDEVGRGLAALAESTRGSTKGAPGERTEDDR
ncbi:ATP-grasp domain-containing protein [Streptomyces brasiliscabiei]|uniref:ATP-grasp domain-containing protein n=1 Tax=Streptomyces brasiliscabiei TaxID=2736302 RepID=A0ABU8GQ41_9ACTN